MSTSVASVLPLIANTAVDNSEVWDRLDAATAEQRDGRNLRPALVALDMPGVLVTLVVLDEDITHLWDAPVHTPAMRRLRLSATELGRMAT